MINTNLALGVKKPNPASLFLELGRKSQFLDFIKILDLVIFIGFFLFIEFIWLIILPPLTMLLPTMLLPPVLPLIFLKFAIDLVLLIVFNIEVNSAAI